MRLVVVVVALLLTLVAVTPARAQGVELLIRAPMPGETVIGDSMGVIVDVPEFKIVPSTVTLEEAGKLPEVNRVGEGHLHLMLDLEPMVIWSKTEPYVFTKLSPGPHLLTIEVVQNDHSSMDPPVLQQVRFTVVDADTASTAAPAIPSIMPNTGRSMDEQWNSLLLVIGAGMLIVTGFVCRRRCWSV